MRREDERLRDRFESCTLPAGDFGHRTHLRLAWIYLRGYPPAEAFGRFSRALARYAGHLGKPGLYHETITWGFLLLMRERVEGAPDQGWEAFAAAHPDLFRWPDGALAGYYSPERLASPAARHGFLMPDRAPGYNAGTSAA